MFDLTRRYTNSTSPNFQISGDRARLYTNLQATYISTVMQKQFVLGKLLRYLTTYAAVSIFKTMILPYFPYCDVIYQGAAKEDLDSLQRFQNKCLEMCQGLERHHSTVEVHRMAKCALLPDRRLAHMCNFMYQRQKNVKLMDNRDIPTRAHDAPLFLVAIPHKESYKRSVAFGGSNIWNALHIDNRNINSFPVFKSVQKRNMMPPVGGVG